MAASALLASTTLNSDVAHAESEEMGGMKIWTTDQAVTEEGMLDDAAKKAKKKAEDEDLCIPIGEGENCW